MRHCQNNVVIRDVRNDFIFPLHNPALLRRPLTAWTVPVVAGRVVHLDTAIRTEGRVKSEFRGFTLGNQQSRASLGIIQRWKPPDFIQMVMKNPSDRIILFKFLTHAVHAVLGRAEEDSYIRPVSALEQRPAVNILPLHSGSDVPVIL